MANTETLTPDTRKSGEPSPVATVVSLDLSNDLQVSSTVSGGRNEIADTRTCYSPSPRCHHQEDGVGMAAPSLDKATNQDKDFTLWEDEIHGSGGAAVVDMGRLSVDSIIQKASDATLFKRTNGTGGCSHSC